MPLDFDTLASLRRNHPAWGLLAARHAPLVASFLERAFVRDNVRVLAEPDLVEALEDALYQRREADGRDAWPKRAVDYLADWARPENGWLRRYYRDGTDEPQYDLTPSTEKAIAWLEGLSARQFVGTESRLLTVFELLRQIAAGSDTDPDSRRAELLARRAAVDAELEALDRGDLPLLDDTAVRDRFQQFAATARELLSDFREVEDNFRKLDRAVRERVARHAGGRGDLLGEILGERDVITGTDQGRSFRAFWDFLMSSARQEELGELLDVVLALPAVAEGAPDRRLRRVHHDWLEAGEHTQRTVAALSRQLRQFMDDQAFVENRRIVELVRRIESTALDVRDAPPAGSLAAIDALRPGIELPMERPLHVPRRRPELDSRIDLGDASAESTGELFAGIAIDRESLAHHARSTLQRDGQASLGRLVEARPLSHGLAELVTWLELADRSFDTVTDEAVTERIRWRLPAEAVEREATLPRIVFVAPRGASA